MENQQRTQQSDMFFVDYQLSKMDHGIIQGFPQYAVPGPILLWLRGSEHQEKLGMKGES